MAKNIQQVYTTNPITTNMSSDLMYFGRSPYGVTDDAAMTYMNFAAQFGTAEQIQAGAFNVGTCTGTNPNYLVTLAPAIASYTEGLIVAFKPSFNNLGTAANVNISSLGIKPIYLPNRYGSGVVDGRLMPNDLNTDTLAFMIYSSGYDCFFLLTANKSYVSGQTVQSNAMISAPDNGATNAYVWNGTQYPGDNLTTVGALIVLLSAANANSGACTLTVAGVTKSIKLQNGTNPPVSSIIVGGSYVFLTTTSAYILLNPAVLPGPLATLDVGSGPVTIVPNTRYIATSSSGSIVFNLPAPGGAVRGDIVKVIGAGTA